MLDLTPKKVSAFNARLLPGLVVLLAAFPAFFYLAGTPLKEEQKFTDKTSLSSKIVPDTTPGQFIWEVNGEPFYLKAVVYAPAKKPSFKNLLTDLSLISEMGANAILVHPGKEEEKHLLRALESSGLQMVVRLPLDAADSGFFEKIDYYQRQKNLLAWSLHLPDSSSNFPAWASETLSAIKREAPHTALILEWPHGNIPEQALPFIDLAGVHLYSPKMPKTALSGSKPLVATAIGGAFLWDTFVSGMPWPFRYPEISSFEKARHYVKLWNILEKDRGSNLGGAVYCWSDHLTREGELPGITDHKGRLKPAYYALKELWTGLPQQFPLQDVILKAEHLFHNGDNLFQIIALAPFHKEQVFTYEWYSGNDTTSGKPLLLDFGKSTDNVFLFKLKKKIKEKTGRPYYTTEEGRVLRIKQELTVPGQRIYLSVADHQNNVVTASFPIDPDHIIQRIPWQ